jgi:uncharacterized protein YjiS (DUF1127 family)
MQIQSSLTSKATRTSILDRTLIFCALGTLLALLLVLDAYEYTVVPGASSLKGREKTLPSQQQNMVPDTNEPKKDLQIQLEEAQRYIEEKRLHLKEMSVDQIEDIAESDGVDDTQLKVDEARLESQQSESIEDEVLEDKIKEEKEEIIHEIVEKEAGLDDWCANCIWLGTSDHSCEARLGWIKRYYKAEDDSGKIALMKEGCSVKDGKVGKW